MYLLGMYRISGSDWPDIRPFFYFRPDSTHEQPIISGSVQIKKILVLVHQLSGSGWPDIRPFFHIRPIPVLAG
jgi:hypothetical protein